VRNLTLAYALAGADCIDVAADLAVISAAKEGLEVAKQLAKAHSRPYQQPWLMVSMSAGEDPHFRKAWFDPKVCPADCPRPCENICPASAIASTGGIIRDRCYGCGRCLPVCPLGLIEARSQPTTIDAIARQVLTQADALEIHTQVGQLAAVKTLWQSIAAHTTHLQLMSVSCPDSAGYISYLKDLQQLMGISPEISPSKPFFGLSSHQNVQNVMWQTDGRPMSGDIGKGTTHAAIRLAQKVIESDVVGFIQLAGGTNQYTVQKLKKLGLLGRSSENVQNGYKIGDRVVSGIAYGSFARHLLMPIISETLYLEEVSPMLWKAVAIAESLVKPLKQSVVSK